MVLQANYGKVGALSLHCQPASPSLPSQMLKVLTTTEEKNTVESRKASKLESFLLSGESSKILVGGCV